MPEATVKANVAKRRQGIESHSGALGKTNRRILTDAEEDILVNLIEDAMKRGRGR